MDTAMIPWWGAAIWMAITAIAFSAWFYIIGYNRGWYNREQKAIRERLDVKVVRIPDEQTVEVRDRKRQFSRVRRSASEAHISQPRPWWNPDRTS